MSRALYSIAPHAPFLDLLADRVLDGTLTGDWPRTGPFWLSDITIVLPTRRARLKLAEAFSRRGHALLPDIRTFGGEVAEEEPFLPPFDAPALPPAVSMLERRLVLSRLVAAWAHSPAGGHGFSTPPHAGEILALADSLGQLIDDLAAEGRTARDLDAIVPADLAVNWQQTLAFLEIALAAWPALLAERGKDDASTLRNQRLDRQAQTADLIFGDRPVIAAGSTGSIPATARLLAAIENLPRGALVLPGLDTSLSADDHAALLDETKAPHGHPQYGLAMLLGGLNAGIRDVVELAPDIAPPRTRLVRHALALTEATAHWADNRLLPLDLASAIEDMAVLAAHTEDEQARAVALAARAALAQKRSVGIVTPDQNLARRIASELLRFGIEVDDAAGEPLFQSAAGRLARQILALATGDFAPVDLMALLRNAATGLNRSRTEIAALAERLELGLLRGQRPGPGLAGLRALFDANLDGTTKYPALKLSEADRPAFEDLFARLETAMAPLLALCRRDRLTAGDFAEALLAAYGAVTGGAGLPPGDTELRRWAAELLAHRGEGHAFPPRHLDGVLRALMAGHEVRNTRPRREDIAIWGQLEARLQAPDLMIVAALNEDKWPEPAEPGPWLSRGMRLAAGLEPPERKQGLAAHDFEMALGNRQVILAFAERIGTSPALPSRLLQRLEAFIGEGSSKTLRARGRFWIEQARRLDAVPEIRRAPIPAPNPPADQRPRKLSVTEIETLFRSPYDIYAKHVLGLRQLDRLGDDPDARERGNIIHQVFGDFVLAGHDVNAPQASDILRQMAEEAFSGLDAIADRRDIWLRRFARAADQFLDYERARDHLVAARHAEHDGKWVLPLDPPFTLSGRADRVDVMADRTVEIIDFKTGSIPQPKEMAAFDAPQLLLEAAMVAAGAINEVPALPASALTYIKIGLGPRAFTERAFSLPKSMVLTAAVDEAARRAQTLIEALLYHQRPMAAQVRPKERQSFAGPYEHLARVAEWRLAEGDDLP